MKNFLTPGTVILATVAIIFGFFIQAGFATVREATHTLNETIEVIEQTNRGNPDE